MRRTWVLVAAVAGCQLVFPLGELTGGGADAGDSSLGDAPSGDASAPVCDASLDTDNNCGWCGHRCLGLGCSAGVCNATQVRSMSSWTLAYSAGKVYYGDNNPEGGVYALDTATTGIATIASNQNTVLGVAAQPPYVVWANAGDGTVWRATLDGGSATLIATGNVGGLAVNSTTIFWADDNASVVHQVGLVDGGAGPDIGGLSHPHCLAANDAWVVIIDTSSLYQAQAGTSNPLGAEVPSINDYINAAPCAVAAPYVFAGGGGSETTVYRFDQGTGGQPGAGIGAASGQIFNVYADDGGVFWTSHVLGGAIEGCTNPSCDGGVHTYARDAFPLGLTSDGTWLYYTAPSSVSLNRVAR